MKRTCLLLAILFLAHYSDVTAGWSEDIRLTNRFQEIYPQVVARNDTVHIGWEQIAEPWHVSYLRSTDGGNVWSEPRNLEDTTTHYGVHLDLWLSGDHVFVGWEDVIRSDFVSDLGFTYSVGGGDWHPPGYVFGHHVSMYEPGIANFEDSIYAVYHSREHDSTGNNPLRFIYSGDMGASWSEEVTVGHVSEYTNFLHVAHCRNGIYVVWASDLPPLGFYREVMATVSQDGGQSWSDVMQLSSPDSAAAQRTCIACDEETGNFAVGWMDYGLSGGFPGDLYVRITTDGGYTWLPESHATTHHGVWDSALAIKNDSLWAVWTDFNASYGSGNEEICFSKSSDLGESWSPYERLTNALGHSVSPGIAYDNGKLHVVWYDIYRPPDSTGHSDIYYKRFDPEVGIENEPGINQPNRIILSAYPNPFNSATTITLTGQDQAEIAIYDITGRLITTLHTSGGQAVWEASGCSSGLYFARVNGNNTTAIKLILMK